MAAEKGLTCLLMVGATASAPSTYTALEGQTDTSFDGSVQIADTTDKSTGAWTTGLATTRSGAVSCSGNLYTSRAQLTQLETAWVNGTTHACKIVFDAGGKGYTGDFYVTSFNISGATTDVTKYQVSLTPAGALTAVP